MDLSDLIEEIKVAETDVAIMSDKVERAVLDFKVKQANLVANTPFKSMGIKNQHGRDSYITMKSVEEAERIVLAKKEYELANVKYHALQNIFDWKIAELRGVDGDVLDK